MISFTVLFTVLVLAQLALVIGVFAFRSQTEKWFADLKKGDISGSIYSWCNDLVYDHQTPMIIALAVMSGVEVC